ncbi:PaaI family thioesterase [Nocardiopsis coralliicola]
MDTRTAITVEDARRVLAAQPFSSLVGAELEEFGGGRATLVIDVRDALRQQHGFLHGGVLAYAADNAITFAAGTVLGPELLTLGMAIDYLRPVRGGRLYARASVAGSGRSRATCRCDLLVLDGAEPQLCAVAQGTAVVPTAGAPQRAGTGD